MIAFLRTLQENRINNYAIIAASDRDTILQTAYADKVIYIRKRKQLCLQEICMAVNLAMDTYKEQKCMIVPSTEALNRFLLKNREIFENNHCIIPLVEESLYESISDKEKFWEICRERGLCTPDILDAGSAYQSPFVAKPKKYFGRDGKAYSPVIIKTQKDFLEFKKNYNEEDFTYQEYINGESYYLLFYFGKDKTVYKFSQVNYAQQPGGKSILAAGCCDLHLNESVTSGYEALFLELGFYGLVMVELRKSGNEFYMIEANPRFWGPSQLFCDAGYNFFEILLRDYGYLEQIPERKINNQARYLWSGGFQGELMKDKKCMWFGNGKSEVKENIRSFLEYDIYHHQDTLNIFHQESGRKKTHTQFVEKAVVVSVGMGHGQVEFIKRLKHFNYQVAAFGKGKNAKEAKELADYSAEIDTQDAESAIAWIDSLGVKVIGVGSYAGGKAVYTVQRLSNYYHVSTSIPEELLVGANKISQQKLYEKYGLSTIKTWKITEISIEDLEKTGAESFILKPSVGRGSEGIKVVDKGELENCLKKEIADKEEIVQVVHKGIEYRCIIIVQHKKVKLLAPIKRQSYRDSVFLGVLRYSDTHKNVLERFIEEFIEKSGICNAIIKADIIVSEASIDVIEMDIGVGGGTYYKTFVSHIYGRSLMDEYIRLITDQEVKDFEVAEPDLRMDYIFNQKNFPIDYNIIECENLLKKKLGECEIIINQLHPENRGGYSSNADFIFTVIYKEDKNAKEEFFVDSYVNDNLFYKECESYAVREGKKISGEKC